MPCFLLHMMEQPSQTPYADPDLKDLVGQFPRLFCAQCNPPRELLPSESLRCFELSAPCWKEPDAVCEEEPEQPAPPTG